MGDIAPGWRFVDAAVAVHRRLGLARLGRAKPYLMLVPALVLVSLLAVGLVNLLWLSIHSFDTFLFRQGPLSAEQYRRLLGPPTGEFYREVFLRTLVISLLVTVAAVAIGLPVAYFIVRTTSRVVRSIALLLLLVPFLMGEAVRAFGWSLILGRRGAVPWLLGAFGIDSRGVLGTELAIWIGLMQVSIPLAALLAMPAVRRIDPALEQAARTLGARPGRVWLHVIAPLARPGMAAGAAVVFLLSIAEYDLPQILGLGQLPFVANIVRGIYTLQGNINLGSAFSMVIVVLSTAMIVAAVGLSGIRRRRRPSTEPGEGAGAVESSVPSSADG